MTFDDLFVQAQELEVLETPLGSYSIETMDRWCTLLEHEQVEGHTRVLVWNTYFEGFQVGRLVWRNKAYKQLGMTIDAWVTTIENPYDEIRIKKLEVWKGKLGEVLWMIQHINYRGNVEWRTMNEYHGPSEYKDKIYEAINATLGGNSKGIPTTA